MIKSVSVINHINVRTDFELSDPDPTGIAVKSISGLGPSDGVVNISEFASLDGGNYSSSRLPSREIVLNLGVISTISTVEEARLNLYKWFPILKNVTLIFKTDIREYYINGIVKSLNPDIFSENESVQVTISCPDPYFREYGGSDVADGVNNVIYKVQPMFEFPFSNESLTENLIEFSRINNIATLSFFNPGADNVGGIFTFRFYGPVQNPYIVNETTNEIFRIQTDQFKEIYGFEFSNGDVAEISTIPKKKKAILYHDGIEYNLLNAVRRDSKWITFVRGENKIYYFADNLAENADLKVNMDHIYEGI